MSHTHLGEALPPPLLTEVGHGGVLIPVACSCFLGMWDQPRHPAQVQPDYQNGVHCGIPRCVYSVANFSTSHLQGEGSTQPHAGTTFGLESSSCETTSGIVRSGRGRKRRKTVSVQGCRGTPARQTAEFGQDAGKSNSNLKKSY